MKLLCLPQADIDLFLSGGIPSSYPMASSDTELIHRIEQKYKAVIYYAMKDCLDPIGNIFYFLPVSCYTDDWEDDRQDLMHNIPVMYYYAPEWLNTPDHMEAGGVPIYIEHGKLYVENQGMYHSELESHHS